MPGNPPPPENRIQRATVKKLTMSRYSKIRKVLFAGGLWLAQAPMAWALDNPNENTGSLTVRGFGTLGATRSSSGEAGFVRDLSQPQGSAKRWSAKNDSNIGLQLNWAASTDLELVGQAVSRYHYDGSYDPEVSLAFAKWNPDARTSVRIGRVSADFLMLSDSRLVGYSYLPVRPSVDYFGQLFLSRLDGADLSLTFPTDAGVFRAKAFAGRVNEKVPYSLGVWDTEGSNVNGLILNFQRGPWTWRGSLANVRFSSNHEFSGLASTLRTIGSTYGYASATSAADAISVKGTTSTYYSFGFVYDDGPVLVQGMVNQIDNASHVFQNSNAAYFLAGYRMGTLTPYSGVSRVKSSYKNLSNGLPAGAGFDTAIQSVNGLMAATTMNQTTWTVGTRWDFQPNMALKLQWDAIRGKPESRFLFSAPSARWNGKTDVVSVTLDFIF